MSEKTNDFRSIGLFKNLDANVLKPELEKRGITAKLLYPGTSIAPDATANAQDAYFEFLVQEKDHGLAKQVCAQLNIQPVKKMETGENTAQARSMRIFGWIFLAMAIITVLAIILSIAI